MSLMALHNYIRRKTQENHVFVEFDCHLNFIHDDIWINVITYSDAMDITVLCECIMFVKELQLI
jgi:hypothetical protein